MAIGVVVGCRQEPVVVTVHIEPDPVTVEDRPTCVATNAGSKVTWQWTHNDRVVQVGEQPRWPVGVELEVGDRLTCKLRQRDKVVAEARTVVREVVSEELPPNVLILLADDLGVDQLRSFGAGQRAPRTPVLDGLADQGLRFTRAYADAICSPSRATLLSGRYARRSGVGTGITLGSREHDLPTDEVLLPEMLRDSPSGPWDSSMLGKWHLTSNPELAKRAPLDQGFQWFAGTPGNLSDENARGEVKQGYHRWQKSTNGEIAWVERYATTETVDDALERARNMRGPWLMYVAFHAAHAPLHVPPGDLRADGPAPDSKLEKYQAAVTALDAEIGRLLRDLPERERTLIFFLGDNGSPEEGVLPGNHPERSKGSLFEGGVHVPLLVLGPGVVQGAESAALVNTTDLFTTIAELARVPLPLRREGGAEVQLDGVSLIPYFRDPALPSIRKYAFAEQFAPPGCEPGACRVDRRALIGSRYKLMHDAVEQTWRLSDLQKDPGESRDLLRTEGEDVRAVVGEMRQELDLLFARLQQDRTW